MNKKIENILPAVRVILSGDKTCIAKFYKPDKEIPGSFFKDNSFKVLEIDDYEEEKIISEIVKSAESKPDFIQIKNLGIIAFSNNKAYNEWLIDSVKSFENETNIKSKPEISSNKRRVEQKIVAITGGAKGFGEGIAKELFSEGANIIIADLDETNGKNLVKQLNGKEFTNKAYFVKTNVAAPTSVEELINETVLEFGGLDVIISNAGVLKAGGLDEMDPKTFEFITNINYTGYFYCSKFASAVMKIQNKFNKNLFFDIIQINSKSGLKGSNKNFAYAGGKFGGIGLTQSFAYELIPYNIKVNSICPGNFFDGPLWSDPENGLFVQYLNTGKVPGAKTIEDVKKHYERQVPAGRGCRIIDVVRAIYYVIEQEYETGQAIPVTGGQNMLR